MIKVSIVRCENYELGSVFPSVRRSIELLGGMNRFVKHGEKTLLNPNLLSARPPEDAVDTHPSVVQSVIRLVKECSGAVTVGDSPGGFSDSFYTEKVHEVSGMKRIALEEDVPLVKFVSSRRVEEFPISEYVLDADKVISIPKLKTHDLTILTAGIKNVYGTITGAYKVDCHLRAPKGEEFAKIVAKVYGIVRPSLTILDAVVVMEGSGPAAGELRAMNLIMASEDAVALDSVVASIVGLRPFDIPSIEVAYKAGYGEADLTNIEVVGEPLAAVAASDFKLPKTKLLKKVPKKAAELLTALIRFKPWIDDAICRRCDMCRKSCPANAISVRKNKYRIDYGECIKCLCCREVCPHRAVSLKRNILAKMIWE